MVLFAAQSSVSFLAVKSKRALQNKSFNFQLYSNLEVQQKIHWDWPAVSDAIRGRLGYIIYYKLDKHKEIRR